MFVLFKYSVIAFLENSNNSQERIEFHVKMLIVIILLSIWTFLFYKLCLLPSQVFNYEPQKFSLIATEDDWPPVIFINTNLIAACFQSSEGIATDIATGMAVSLLFVLCNPWAGRPEVRPRDPPPSYSGEFLHLGLCHLSEPVDAR